MLCTVRLHKFEVAGHVFINIQECTVLCMCIPSLIASVCARGGQVRLQCAAVLRRAAVGPRTVSAIHRRCQSQVYRAPPPAPPSARGRRRPGRGGVRGAPAAGGRRLLPVPPGDRDRDRARQKKRTRHRTRRRGRPAIDAGRGTLAEYGCRRIRFACTFYSGVVHVCSYTNAYV